MQENQLKRKLAAGQTTFGCFLRYANADVAEFLSLQPLDWILFDAEHGTIEPGQCQQMVRAAELRNMTPLVRITSHEPKTILRFMDTGVHGLLMPMVNSAAEAEAVVQAAKYYPIGQRGLAAPRAADFGQHMSLGEYATFANEQTLIAVQIETVEAIAALPEIVKVDHVDVVFVGPADLSQSLGVPGQMQDRKVQDAIEQIARIVDDSDKVLGMMVGNAEAAAKWAQRGARMIATPFEAVIRSGMHAYLQQARGEASIQ